MNLERDLFARGAGLVGWSTRRCLIVPRSISRRSEFAAIQPTLQRMGWPAVERSSGGGIVPQGPGVLNLSLSVGLPASDRGVTPDFEWLCAPIVAWLAEAGVEAETRSVPGAFCDGRFNVVVGGRKLAGTAQRRGRGAALLHMAVMVDADIADAIEAINTLRRAVGRPGEVRAEAHTTLREVLGPSADLDSMRRSLLRRYGQHLQQRLSPASRSGGR